MSSPSSNVLVLINAVANGSVIALSRDATRRRCEADARRAATRARIRARTPQHEAPRAATVATPEQPRGHVPRTCPLPSTPALMWRRATLDDVIDAEVVSEKRLPS